MDGGQDVTAVTVQVVHPAPHFPCECAKGCLGGAPVRVNGAQKAIRSPERLFREAVSPMSYEVTWTGLSASTPISIRSSICQLTEPQL